MQLDDPTLMFAVTIVGAVNALVLAWGALLGARRKPTLYWAAGSLLLAVASACIVLLPQSDSPWRAPVFNALLLIGYACWLVGTLHFFERTVPVRSLLALLALSILVTVWLSVVDPQRELRIFLAAMTVALLRLCTAIVLFQSRRNRNRAVAAVAGMVLLADAAVFLHHAHIGLGGAMPALGKAAHDPYSLTWISMLLSAVVLTPLLMLLGLSRLLEELRRSADEDNLTGIANRRGFLARSQSLPAQKSGAAVAVLMIDVDRFKQINDRFGHAVGDEVLCAMSATLKAVLRPDDIPARWGGEEFCVLLPGTRATQAITLARHLRTDFSRRCRQIPALAASPVTASVGIADGAWCDAGFDTLQRRADAALYEAKRTGRDRVSIADDQRVPTVAES